MEKERLEIGLKEKKAAPLSMPCVKVPQDIIIQLHESGHWILYNVFTQDSLAVTSAALGILRLFGEGKSIETIEEMALRAEGKEFWGGQLLVWEISIFSNLTSPVADPSRFLRNYADWPAPQQKSISSLAQLFLEKHILIKDDAAYARLLGPQSSFLDKNHLGNFHQQIGKKLIFEKRVDPSEWWTKQKFTSDYRELNNTLYKAIQGSFLKSFFNSRFNSNHSVVDLGCGVGYYTKLMGKGGAMVLGVDPNEKYIGLAEREAPPNVTFKQSSIGSPGNLDWIPSQSMDFVFMSDALSFYFVPATFITTNSQQKPDINILFSDIKRILKPGGRFISVEPNGLFLFRPWFGEVERPFTIITEYNRPWYNVVQHYSQAIQAFIKGGFIIKEMVDLPVDEQVERIDSRGKNFAKEFPLWCLFELSLPD